MDIETLAVCKKSVTAANTAAAAANAAAADAKAAVGSIFHDKNFLLTVQADNSLVLRYDPNQIETEE